MDLTDVELSVPAAAELGIAAAVKKEPVADI